MHREQSIFTKLLDNPQCDTELERHWSMAIAAHVRQCPSYVPQRLYIVKYCDKLGSGFDALLDEKLSRSRASRGCGSFRDGIFVVIGICSDWAYVSEGKSEQIMYNIVESSA